MRFARERLRNCGRLACLAASIVVAAAVLFAQQPAQAPPPLVKENAAVKVSEHAWVIPDGNVQVVPNIGIIAGSRATLVVDTGLGLRNGQTVLREVAKVSRNAEMYVVTTHFHPEHAGGVSAFPASAKYIVSQAQQRDLDELASGMAAQFAARTPIMGELLRDVQFRRGDISFDKEYALDLGGVNVRILAVGPTHTRGDTVVWVEGDGVIFAGDVVMNQTILAYGQYSSTRAWMEALAQLNQLRPAEDEHPAVLVPSHGAVGTANIIAYQRGFLQAVQARVRELKQQGQSEAQVVPAVTAEMQARYTYWRATNRIEAVVRNVYAETP
jgi:glyoxylase-like metal-dependent hydrolase (beta-lactamase superfamily II)